jgi:hypothetical protein
MMSSISSVLWTRLVSSIPDTTTALWCDTASSNAYSASKMNEVYEDHKNIALKYSISVNLSQYLVISSNNRSCINNYVYNRCLKVVQAFPVARLLCGYFLLVVLFVR